MASQVESIKWVPGTKFMVDGFAFTNPRCQHYFLTHCHSDHTVGLTKGFNAGTIWCSPVSARLLAGEWGLRTPTVKQLQLHQTVTIDGTTVTALDANHCPGAIMLLFELPSGPGGVVRRILHTGDCRWQDSLYTGSCLAHKPVHTLMLDTTYALPKHTFPPQPQAIQMMAQLMREALSEEPNTLLVVSTYHIGKERAYLGAAAALGLKVYAPAAKLRVLAMLDLPQEMTCVLSSDPASQVHVGCTSLAPDELQSYLTRQQQSQARPWARIMGFRATGWSFRRSGGLHVQRPSSSVALVGIPYSEHSSWDDLRSCVARLRPKVIIPTVNATTRSQQAALVDRFADLMDLSGNKGRIDAYLVPLGPGPSPAAVAGQSCLSADAAAAEPAAGAGASAAPAGTGEAAQELAGSAGPGGSYGPQHAAAAAHLQQVELDTSLARGRQVGSQEHADPCPAADSSSVAEGLFDLSSVDVLEQQRLLEEAARRQRLQKSLLLQRKGRLSGRVSKRPAAVRRRVG